MRDLSLFKLLQPHTHTSMQLHYFSPSLSLCVVLLYFAANWTFSLVLAPSKLRLGDELCLCESSQRCKCVCVCLCAYLTKLPPLLKRQLFVLFTWQIFACLHRLWRIVLLSTEQKLRPKNNFSTAGKNGKLLYLSAARRPRSEGS